MKTGARLAAIMLLALASAPLVAATDGPGIAVVGFSRDGSSFAFEQFGLSGREGFPYSDLQILDTTTGLPVAGAPFRTSFDVRAANADQVRRITYEAAQRTLKRLNIGELGTVLLRGSGDFSDKASLEAPVTIDTVGSGILKIENKEAKDKECLAIGVKARSLTVDIMGSDGKPLRRLVNEPKIPPERFCPLGYALVELRVLPREGKPPVLALVLARTVPSIDGTERAFQAHLIDLAAPPIGTEEKKGEH